MLEFKTWLGLLGSSSLSSFDLLSRKIMWEFAIADIETSTSYAMLDNN